jgi:hypothetical protein
VKRPDNGLLPGTSDNDSWREPGNERAAVCDSGTLSGTSIKLSVEEERRRRCRAPRKPDAIPVHGADLTVGQLPTIPDRLLYAGNLRTQNEAPSWRRDRGEMAHTE